MPKPLRSLALICALLTACQAPTGGRASGWVRYPDQRPSTAIPLRVDRRPDGLIVEQLRDGDGLALQELDHAFFHFTGWLADDEEKFDSTLDRGLYLEYRYGQTPINPGWDAGVRGMRVGAKRRLRVPAALGYGARGAGPVPPDADLIYELELLHIKQP
jgi:FKBP-type peptidyl-prolyl cis-trans isomerase FkpA